MENSDAINTYLQINFTNKAYYLQNNQAIKDKNISTELLYDLIHDDLDILFRVIKMAPNKNGYVYWFDAVFLNIVTEKPHISVCNDIYKVIAMKYNTSSMAVERAMRLCLEATLHGISKKEDENFITCYLKNSLVNPHNSEILSKLTKLIISKDFQQRKYSF